MKYYLMLLLLLVPFATAYTYSFPVTIEMHNQSIKLVMPDGTYNYACGADMTYDFQSSVQFNESNFTCQANNTYIYNYSSYFDYDYLYTLLQNKTCPEPDWSSIENRMSNMEQTFLSAIENDIKPKQDQIDKYKANWDNVTIYYNEEQAKNRELRASINYSNMLLYVEQQNNRELRRIVIAMFIGFCLLVLLSAFDVLPRTILAGGFKMVVPKSYVPKENIPNNEVQK